VCAPSRSIFPATPPLSPTSPLPDVTPVIALAPPGGPRAPSLPSTKLFLVPGIRLVRSRGIFPRVSKKIGSSPQHVDFPDPIRGVSTSGLGIPGNLFSFRCPLFYGPAFALFRNSFVPYAFVLICYLLVSFFISWQVSPPTYNPSPPYCNLISWYGPPPIFVPVLFSYIFFSFPLFGNCTGMGVIPPTAHCPI